MNNYKMLQLFEGIKIEVGEFFYGIDPCEKVERISLQQGEDGWDYVVKLGNGDELYIPKSSVIFAVY